MESFSIEIRLGAAGVSRVRVYGTSWERGAAAYALLGRVGPLIQQLDEAAKLAFPEEQEASKSGEVR